MEKATGWKIPLLFCGGMLVLVGLVWCWRSFSAPTVTPLVPELVARAEALRIDLTADAQGQEFMRKIESAGVGFKSSEEKTQALRGVIETAIVQRRYDAACVASVLLSRREEQTAAFSQIGKAAVASCETLPWGVFAAQALRDPVVKESLHLLLNQEWQRCVQ